MAESDSTATDRDRETAIRTVESAWADGRLREVDRDLRVEGLRRAETLREVEALVGDLAPASYEQVPVTPVAPDPPEQPGPSRAPLLVGTLVLLLLAGGVVSLAVGASPDVVPGGDDEVDVFTDAGYDDLLADLDEERGSTVVFSAVLYPTYVSLDVPVDATSQRKESVYWDGELDEPSTKGTTTDLRLDLGDVDPEVLFGLIETVRDRVEDPTTWYAIVRAPQETDPTIYRAYATNEFNESASVAATADGTVTYESVPTPPPSR